MSLKVSDTAADVINEMIGLYRSAAESNTRAAAA